jgi:hypothetical protein
LPWIYPPERARRKKDREGVKAAMEVRDKTSLRETVKGEEGGLRTSGGWGWEGRRKLTGRRRKTWCR